MQDNISNVNIAKRLEHTESHIGSKIQAAKCARSELLQTILALKI